MKFNELIVYSINNDFKLKTVIESIVESINEIDKTEVDYMKVTLINGLQANINFFILKLEEQQKTILRSEYLDASCDFYYYESNDFIFSFNCKKEFVDKIAKLSSANKSFRYQSIFTTEKANYFKVLYRFLSSIFLGMERLKISVLNDIQNPNKYIKFDATASKWDFKGKAKELVFIVDCCNQNNNFFETQIKLINVIIGNFLYHGKAMKYNTIKGAYKEIPINNKNYLEYSDYPKLEQKMKEILTQIKNRV